MLAVLAMMSLIATQGVHTTTALGKIVEPTLFPVTSAEPTLVMVGAEQCPASTDFKPRFAGAAPALFPLRHYITRTPEMGDLKYYPTPIFLVFINKQPVDMHVGMVGSQNSFSDATNAEILLALAARNGLATATPWHLAKNHLTPLTNYDYRSVKFFTAEGYDFSNSSFKRTVFSEARLPRASITGAVFDQAVMAHVDLSGARLTDDQARQIIWLHSICPDGSRSELHLESCVGHTSAVIAPNTAPMKPAP